MAVLYRLRNSLTQSSVDFGAFVGLSFLTVRAAVRSLFVASAVAKNWLLSGQESSSSTRQTSLRPSKCVGSSGLL